MQLIEKRQEVRTPKLAIIDEKKARFGNGSAPRALVRRVDRKTEDAGKVRFGNGSAPVVLR